jgi:hypothetical protein
MDVVVYHSEAHQICDGEINCKKEGIKLLESGVAPE